MAMLSIKNDLNYLYFYMIGIVTCLKCMLIPTYFSTDFEVHRNWMAITSNLPLNQWYTENTSQWTLDYPPFFAYFELLLSYFAKYFDSNILKISADPYISNETIIYQRLTVILSDFFLYYSVYLWVKELVYNGGADKNGLTISASFTNRHSSIFSSPIFIYLFLFLFNIGHFIVDHIHFQYNGLLNGLLLLSLLRMIKQQIYWSAFWYAILLNFKHIYLYMAPAYFIFLFTNYCLSYKPNLRINFNVISRLALIVISVFFLSFIPFILHGQFFIVLARLFPFQRGLSHAYWAPNFWACYNGLDVILSKIIAAYGNGTMRKGGSLTSGLVMQSEHQVLFTITPKISIMCVLSIILTISGFYLWKCFQKSKSMNSTRRRLSLDFLELILFTTLAFFLFGYHVHEKAILLILPPMIPLVLANFHYARIFLILSTIGYFSLFPLLYQTAETPIKVLLLLLHIMFVLFFIDVHYKKIRKNNVYRIRQLSFIECFYLMGLLPLQLFYSFGPYIFTNLFNRFPFLPLMLISVYCSLGVIYSFILLVNHFIFR